MINSEDYATSRLESRRTTSELNVPFFWLADQTLTLGMEWNHDQLDDPASMQATNSNGETILDLGRPYATQYQKQRHPHRYLSGR